MELSFKKPLFGKEIEFVLYDVEKEFALPVVASAYKEGLRLSGIFNFYDPDSELSRLNKKRRLTVSDELLVVLRLALDMAKKTNGQYDVSLGKLFQQRKAGSKEEKRSCSYKDIRIAGKEVLLTSPEVLVDLGSVAKGFIVDKLVEHIQEAGVLSGLVDGRGDIRVFGDREEFLGIQHPRDKGKVIGNLRLNNQAVATSGDYNQYHKTFNKSHLIHAKDVISVTVVAPTLTIADLYATALFVVGREERKALLAKEKLIRAFVVDAELRIRKYNDVEELLQ